MSTKGWFKLVCGCALALTLEVMGKLATDDLIQNIKDAKKRKEENIEYDEEV